MRFWRPTGAGFLTRTPTEFKSSGDPSAGYIIIQDLGLDNSTAKAKAIDELNVSAKSSEAGVESFYILERENAEDGDDLIVFARFDSAKNYASFRAAQAGQQWKAAEALAKSVRTTKWNESGVGFLGRG
jgi:heme-degrading monooxygenase HmoA